MKEYSLKIPDELKPKYKEILEYLIVQHYVDEIFTAGACAYLLSIEKHDFQTETLGKFGICYL